MKGKITALETALDDPQGYKATPRLKTEEEAKAALARLEAEKQRLQELLIEYEKQHTAQQQAGSAGEQTSSPARRYAALIPLWHRCMLADL